MNWKYTVLWLILIAFAIVRFGIEPHELVINFASLYKTAAHFFVGGLLGASAFKVSASNTDWWIPALMAGLLTVVEVIAFFITKQ